MVIPQRRHDRPLHYVVNSVCVPPASEKANGNGYDAVDDSLSQLLEVIEEAHGRHRFFFVFLSGKLGRFRHAIPGMCEMSLLLRAAPPRLEPPQWPTELPRYPSRARVAQLRPGLPRLRQRLIRLTGIPRS